VTHPHVFIVEDDELLAAALSVQIEMLGYTVGGIANNAEGAVDTVLARRPELVIMDINLSGAGTGLDAARAIRERYEVPIIFYTARGDVVLRNEIARMGNAKLLQKPVPDEALHEALASFLGFKGASVH
jgi:DNA-binding response OmpR family regulator